MVLYQINVLKALFLTGNLGLRMRKAVHNTVFVYGITTPALTARRHRSQFWIKQEMNNVTLTLPADLAPAAGFTLLIENNFQVLQKARPRRTCKTIGATAPGGTCANNGHLGVTCPCISMGDF